jgi:hypothetical protein
MRTNLFSAIVLLLVWTYVWQMLFGGLNSPLLSLALIVLLALEIAVSQVSRVRMKRR